jgi:hypothetical protein
MLHEKPVLVAFAVSLRSSNPKLISGHIQRTISISPASTSSSNNDSAFGTISLSPSSGTTSPSVQQDQILHIAYSIQSEDLSQKTHIYEVNVIDLDNDIAEVCF